MKGGIGLKNILQGSEMSGEDFPVSAWSELICHRRRDAVAGKERRDLEGKDIYNISYSTYGPILLKQKLEPAGRC